MQGTRVVATLALIATACGGKREPAPASGAPVPTLDAATVSSMTGSSATPPSMDAPAAPASTDAPLADAPLTPVAAAMPPITTVPDFGCIAASSTAHAIACVVGERGLNLGTPSMVTLEFLATGAGAALIEPIALLETQSETDRGADALPEDVRDEVAKRLVGFAPATEAGAIKSTFTGGKLVMSPAVSVHGWTVALKSHRGDAREGAPSFRTELSLRRPGKPTEVLDDGDKTTASIEAHVYDFGDAVIVMQSYDIADEGMIGSVGQVWRCTAANCTTDE